MNKTVGNRLDAAGSVFFEEQLKHVKSKTYDVKHKRLRAMNLLPVETDAPNGAATIAYRVFDMYGVATIIADYAKDFPRVDVTGEEKIVQTKSIGNSYGYSIEEIRRAQMSKIPLEDKRAKAARRGHDEKHDNIAWFGDADANLEGFIDYPGITEYVVPNGAEGSKTWASKTPDEILADVNGIASAISEPTNGIEEPDTLFVAQGPYNDIAFRRVTDGDSKTVMQYILDNHPTINAIERLPELDGAGAGGTDRFMALVRDVDHLGYQMPQPFEQFEYDKEGMEYVIPCHSKSGGMIIYYPQSVAYGDGI